MRNKILTLFRNNVPYIKELRQLSGSVTASILMQQLDYWFEKKPGGFYKFLEPCENNELYKTGDSWTEELGFSKYEFKTAFEKIGVSYKSKNEFKKAMEKGDPFQGKFYCCYVDKMKYITVYYRNHELLDLELDKLLNSVSEESSFTVSEETLFREIKKVDLRENEVKAMNLKGENTIPVNEESRFTVSEETCFRYNRDYNTEKETTVRDEKKSSDSKNEKTKKEDYRRHSQNENIRTKEVEQAWKECGLAEYKYTPVENMNIAIKTFGLVEVVKAIQRISKSSLMKTKTNIDSFFNKNNDFEQIRKTLNSSYDDREKKTETITATGNINMRYFQ